MRISDWSSDVCSSDLLHVRPGADHGHITEQDINELRDLVQIGPAQQGADSRDTRVVLVGLTEVGIRLVDHRAELQASEDLPMQAETLLPEKYGKAEGRRVGKEWCRTWRERGAP